METFKYVLDFIFIKILSHSPVGNGMDIGRLNLLSFIYGAMFSVIYILFILIPTSRIKESFIFAFDKICSLGSICIKCVINKHCNPCKFLQSSHSSLLFCKVCTSFFLQKYEIIMFYCHLQKNAFDNMLANAVKEESCLINYKPKSSPKEIVYR